MSSDTSWWNQPIKMVQSQNENDAILNQNRQPSAWLCPVTSIVCRCNKVKRFWCCHQSFIVTLSTTNRWASFSSKWEEITVPVLSTNIVSHSTVTCLNLYGCVSVQISLTQAHAHTHTAVVQRRRFCQFVKRFFFFQTLSTSGMMRETSIESQCSLFSSVLKKAIKSFISTCL